MSKVLSAASLQLHLASVLAAIAAGSDDTPATQLVAGQVYAVRVGKIGSVEIVNLEFEAQREFEGKEQYKFKTDGFEGHKILSESAIVRYAEDGTVLPPSRKSSKTPEQLAKEQAELTTALAEAVAREQLNVGQSYPVKLGRGDTARVELGELLGEGTDPRGVSQLNFMFGEGFEAYTLKAYRSAVQTEVEVPEDDTGDGTDQEPATVGA